RVEQPAHRERMEEVFRWRTNNYPNLKPDIKWKHPMSTDHGTFIIGFSVSNKHMAVAPEAAAITDTEDDIVKAGYDYTRNIIRIPWGRPVAYPLLAEIMRVNLRTQGR